MQKVTAVECPIVVVRNGRNFICECASGRGALFPAIRATDFRRRTGIAIDTLLAWIRRGCLHLDGDRLWAAQLPGGQREWYVDAEDASRIERGIKARTNRKRAVPDDRLFLTHGEAKRTYGLSWVILNSAIARGLIKPKECDWPHPLFSRVRIEEVQRRLAAELTSATDPGDPVLPLREIAERLGVPFRRLQEAANRGALKTQAEPRPGSLGASRRVARLSDAKAWLTSRSKAFADECRGVYLVGGRERQSVRRAARELGVRHSRILHLAKRKKLKTIKVEDPCKKGVLTVDLEETRKALEATLWAPKPGFLSRRELASRLGIRGALQLAKFLESLRRGQASRAFTFERRPAPPRAFFYQPGETLAYLSTAPPALRGAERSEPEPAKRSRRGRPSDWTECHKYVAARKHEEPSATIRELMTEFKSKHPDKKITVKKTTIAAARMALSRLRSAIPQ
jgi:hypothetical protein